MARPRQDEDGPAVRVELASAPDRPRAWTLLVDGTPQSHVDLDDPQYLEFEYVRWLGHLADLAAPPGTPLDVLHLGGGGLTLARYVAASRPASSQLAVEADPEVAELVRQRLPLDQRPRRAGGGRAGRVRVRVADARSVLAEVPADSADLVIADLFAGSRTPAHLTSAEFDAAVGRVLRPAGYYAINVGDGPPLAHARARVATVRSVFARACLIADPGVGGGRRGGPLVLMAAQHDLPVAGLTRRAAADPFPGRVVHGRELDQFAATARPITDERAEPSPAPPAGIFAVR
jgi:spermidine synthase